MTDATRASALAIATSLWLAIGFGAAFLAGVADPDLMLALGTVCAGACGASVTLAALGRSR